MRYKLNPDREKPWNDLPELPIAEGYYRDIEVYEHYLASK